MAPLLSALWECDTKVRANRRLPKSTSTLAMPLEDPDDREIALESGMLLIFSCIYSLMTTFPYIDEVTLLWICLYCPSPTDCIESHSVKVRAISQAALTHRLKKLKSKMIKCRQCDTYIVVSGVECEKVCKWGEKKAVDYNGAE